MSTTSNKCVTLQKSVGWCQGRPELPSIMSRVYYINKGEIVAFPQLPRDEMGRAKSSVLNGSFTLAADATWKYIDILPDKSQHSSEGQGEIPYQTQLNKLTLVHPGVGEEATALCAWLNNSDNVFVFQDMSGRWRVVGSYRWTTKTVASQDNGQGPTGTTSTTITVEAYDEVASPFYTGELETEAGTIQCGAAA